MYSSKMDVPQKCKKLEECNRFSTPMGPLPMHRCRWHSNTDPSIEMSIVPSQPTKDFYAQMKKSLHPSKVSN
jgi:hypothetical protein